MKTKYDDLSAMYKLVYDKVNYEFTNKKYEIKLNGGHYDADGYVSGYVVIGGYDIRCSFNRKDYICWHDDFFEPVMNAIPHLERKIALEVRKAIGKGTEEWKKVRIAELEAELKQLKGE